jgi:hypothetical protein
MWAKHFNPSELAAGSVHFPAPPTLLLVFGPTDALKRDGQLAGLMEKYPDAMQLACSTGTAVGPEGLGDDGFSGLALGFDRTRLAVETETMEDPGQSRAVGRMLGKKLAAPDLAGVYLMTDGLSVNGSALVLGLQDVLGQDAEISGGMAGDGARFGETLVSLNGKATAGSIAAIGFYGDAIRFSHGCVGGWDAFGPRRRITSAQGSVLYELDGKPALDLYESYLGTEAADLPSSGLLYPLVVWDPAKPEETYVRTLLSIDREAKSLTFAGDVPEAWQAQLMRGSADRLIDGASQAAVDAAKAMAAQGATPVACLLVSCVGRRLLPGQQTEEEFEVVRNVLGPDVELAGYYSYGEIAPRAGSQIAGLHNQTMTLTLLAEVP